MSVNWSLICGWVLGLLTAAGFFQFWASTHCGHLLGTLVCR